MKAWLIIALLVASILQAVPKQADKPRTNKSDSKELSEQPQKPTARSTENTGSAGPSPPKKENSTNSKANQSGWCEKILSPLVLNWPLVAVAIWGIIVAIRTLNTIREQTEATRKAAEAAEKSVRLQEENSEAEKISLVRLNRSYLTINSWIATRVAHNTFEVKFRIYNPSGSAARIERIQWKLGNTIQESICGRMLTPREGYWVVIPPEKISEPVLISGRVSYTDIFHKERHRRFATFCVLKGTEVMPTFHDAEGVGLNDEEEWDKEDS